MFLLVAVGCASAPAASGKHAIVVAGARVPVDARVVLWDEPGGYRASPDHYGVRKTDVHQIVLHYDVAGTSARCFEVLEKRGLSCHFLVDVDGTIYQTVDVRARAWHAAEANDASVGIEIANVGAYGDRAELERFPARGEPVRGRIHGVPLWQYPFTDAQYVAVGRLCDALARAMPRIRRRTPPERGVLPGALEFEGVLGHYHLTRGKVDPGPAFDWDRFAKEMQ